MSVRALVRAAVLAAAACAAREAAAQAIFPAQIAEAAAQGFGDRNNSQPWAMAWWRNKLYVGTGRSTFCVQAATTAYFYPNLEGYYPPKEEDIDCTPDPYDLPLQAEIWRWTPETDTWEMIYRSPNDVPIQGTEPVRFTARDIGFRGMLVFTEADGTEALYVAGVTSRGGAGVGFLGPVPPPRLLRSTDGETFNAVPQDPGTFLGDITVTGFRNMVSHRGRMFLVASVGLLGHGLLLEAAHPELGNDAFRNVSPPHPTLPGVDLTFFEIAAFQGSLYVGTGVQPLNDDTPFSLLKTDAAGSPPYTFTTVIPDGGYKKFGASPAVISLSPFRGRLYVGTDREVMRVNPDDTWDLVVGTPRNTPDGIKLAPISGFDMGFDYQFNIHMWRMGRHGGAFYIGTQDQSAKWRNNPVLGPLVSRRMGADLFSTGDGWHYSLVTDNGLGDPFNNGVRNFASTPFGMFMGTANHTFGTRIYRGRTAAAEVSAPVRLEVDRPPNGAVLSWEGSPTAVRFHVMRYSGYALPTELAVTDALAPTGRFFVDGTVQLGAEYHYHVVAEDAAGRLSGPSNTVRIPVLSPIPTFSSLWDLLYRWGAPGRLLTTLQEARAAAEGGRLAEARVRLQRLRTRVKDASVLPPWRREDLEVLLAKFDRRITLAELGLIGTNKLMWLP
jgi:hypothetical protein